MNKTEKEATLFDKELDIVHKCLQDLYNWKYNDENCRIERIKKCLNDIDELKNKRS